MAHRIVLLHIEFQTELSRQVEQNGHQKRKRFATSGLGFHEDILLFQNEGECVRLDRRRLFDTISKLARK